MIKLQLVGPADEVEVAIERLRMSFDLLTESMEYRLRNSQYVRRSIEMKARSTCKRCGLVLDENNSTPQEPS